MTSQQARALAGKLFAAFPGRRSEATIAVYVEALERLGNGDRALEAVDILIAGERRLPPIALIRETYQRLRPPPAPELDPGPLTDEQIAANIRRAKVISCMLAGELDLEQALERIR